MTRLITTLASAYYLWNARSKARKNRARCNRLVAEVRLARFLNFPGDRTATASAQGGTHD